MFPAPEVEDFLLEVKYDGPSFDGIMEIHVLGNELLGFETSIHKVISALRSAGKIDLKDVDFDIVVEGFENNCFKKRIKLVFKTIEKYPTTSIIIAGAIGGIITIILQYKPIEIKKMSPDLMQKIGDTASVQLLQDKDFLGALANTVQPLANEKDQMILRKPVKEQNQEICIDFSKKKNFSDLVCEEPIDEAETTRHDEVFGRIVAMDLDASINQIDFKVAGEGERIRCSVGQGMNINDYTNLLGKWVTISGVVTEKGEGKITHIDVEKFTKEEPPESEHRQGNLF